MELMREREKKRREGMQTRLAASRERQSFTEPPPPHRNWVDWLKSAGFEGCNVYVKIVNGGLTTKELGGAVGFNFSEAAAVGRDPTRVLVHPSSHQVQLTALRLMFSSFLSPRLPLKPPTPPRSDCCKPLGMCTLHPSFVRIVVSDAVCTLKTHFNSLV